MAADAGQTQTLGQLGLSAQGGAKGGGQGARDLTITGLAVDSRDVRDGFLFAAMPGTRVHVLNATGHCPHMTVPADVVAAMRDHLGEV